MFEKTFSFWRRLVGGANAPADANVHDDRRLWSRFPADVQGHLQLAEKTDGTKIKAHLRDLSLGGANLAIDRPLELGQMLSLELPCVNEEVRTILACVVRVNAQSDGLWTHGCVFARELTEDDLQRFGAKKVVADEQDQRTWVRYQCTLQASFRKVGDDAAQPQPAQILNISANGIGLSLLPAIQAGTLLNVDLLDRNGRLVRTLLACVVHTTHRTGGDFAIGCNFIRELSEEELHAIL